MRIKQDDLWLCVDCLFAAINGDFSSILDENVQAVEAGLERLGPHLVPDFDSETGEGHEEFSNCGCDCCGSNLAGEMHRFAVLEPVDESDPEAVWAELSATLAEYSEAVLDDASEDKREHLRSVATHQYRVLGEAIKAHMTEEPEQEEPEQ